MFEFIEHDKLWCNPDQIDRDVRDGQLLKTMMLRDQRGVLRVELEAKSQEKTHVCMCASMRVCMHVRKYVCHACMNG